MWYYTTMIKSDCVQSIGGEFVTTTTKRVCATVEKNVADLLKIDAVQKNTTVTEIIKGLIDDYLKSNKIEGTKEK